MYRMSRDRDDGFGDPLPLNIYDAKAKNRRHKKGAVGKIISSLLSVTGVLLVLLAGACCSEYPPRIRQNPKTQSYDSHRPTIVNPNRVTHAHRCKSTIIYAQSTIFLPL